MGYSPFGTGYNCFEKFYGTDNSHGLQWLVAFGMVDIKPGGQVFLTAEGFEVVAHRGDDADFEVILAFGEEGTEVV